MSYHLYILHFITQEQIFRALKLTLPKRPTWSSFCGPDLFKFDQIFFLPFLTLFHMHTKFQVPAISRSAQNRNYIFFSSGVP